MSFSFMILETSFQTQKWSKVFPSLHSAWARPCKPMDFWCANHLEYCWLNFSTIGLYFASRFWTFWKLKWKISLKSFWKDTSPTLWVQLILSVDEFFPFPETTQSEISRSIYNRFSRCSRVELGGGPLFEIIISSVFRLWIQHAIAMTSELGLRTQSAARASRMA